MIWIVIAFILVGLLLLILEALVIPGTGIAGIIGFGMLIAGIWIAYSDLGTQTGTIVLVLTVLINILAVWLAMRYKTWKRLMLKEEIDGKVNGLDKTKIKVGDRGITVSRCAPIGKAEINGIFVEVDARTGFIDQENPIEVIKIEGNKIFVKPIK